MSSWEIFMTAFRHGTPVEFDTAVLRDVLQRGALPHPAWPPPHTDFLYEDGHMRTDIAYLGPRADCFVVERIFGRTAVARLLEAAARLDGLIFWPASPPDAVAAVACKTTFAHLPEDIGGLTPILTEDPDAFIEAVGFSSKMTKQEWLQAQAERDRWYEQHERGFRSK